MLSQAKNRWKRWTAVAVILGLFVYLGIYFFGNIEFLNGLGWMPHLGLVASMVCVSGMLGTGAATLQYHSLLRDEAAQSLLQHAVDKQIKTATIAVTVQPIVGNTTSDIYQQINTPEHHTFMCNTAVSEFKKKFFQMDIQQVEESIAQINAFKEDYLKVHPEHKNDYLGGIKRAGYEHEKEPVAKDAEIKHGSYCWKASTSVFLSPFAAIGTSKLLKWYNPSLGMLHHITATALSTLTTKHLTYKIASHFLMPKKDNEYPNESKYGSNSEAKMDRQNSAAANAVEELGAIHDGQRVSCCERVTSFFSGWCSFFSNWRRSPGGLVSHDNPANMRPNGNP